MKSTEASRLSATWALGARYTAARATSLLLAITFAAGSLPTAALAVKSSQTDSQADTQPARGTMLIPLTPKIDTAAPSASQTSNGTEKSNDPTHPAQPETASCETASADDLHPQPEKSSPELGSVEAESADGSEMTEGTTLKGTIQMVADDTEYDQQKNTFLGTGNAIVYIGGQDAKLEADTILYDQNNEIIDARGNVRILRDGRLTTGSAFKFKVTSDEYLITKPDTEVQGTTVIARKAVGTKNSMAFKTGTVMLPQPFHIVNNIFYGPLGSAESFMQQYQHPDAYRPAHPSFRFKARKIIYEKYKENNNLTIYGGQVMFGNFGIPLPKMVLTASSAEQRAVMPITPVISNNMQMGGTSIGPQFNFKVGKNGVFSCAPLVQLGGSQLSKDNPNYKKLGAGVRLGYVSDQVTAHVAYGSVSNMLVAEYKYRFSKGLLWQSGINRYIEDGVFGYRRARLLGEAVYIKSVTNIPFLTGINFRTAGGFAQDNPALLNQTPDLQKLYNTQGNQGKLFALRLQEQITTTTQPLFAIGDNVYGAKAYIYGGAGLKGYSTGDSMGLIQAGPVLDLKLSRLRLQTGYTQTGISGKSPFVFDQFIQGSRSANLNGDIRLCKYLTVGGQLGYNLDAKALYQKTIKVAIGPDDFKLLVSHDTLSGYNRLGFNVLYGAPVSYDRLVLKGSPDCGKLGGI